MRTRHRKAAAALLAVLVPFATVTGLLAVGTSPALAGTSQILDDFENQDFAGWDRVDSLQITGSAIKGDYAAYHPGGGGHNHITFSDGTTTSMTLWVKAPSGSNFNFYLRDGGGTQIAQLSYSEIVGEGWVRYEITNIDYGSNNYDITVTDTQGNTVYSNTNEGFDNGASDIAELNFGGGTSAIDEFYLDEILLNGFSRTTTVSGTVTNTAGEPVSGATISTNVSGTTATTASDGTYSIDLKQTTHELSFSKSGYLDDSESVTVGSSSISGVSATLGYPLIGQMVDQSGNSIANATVTVYGATEPTVPDSIGQLENLSDPIPTDWESQLSNGFSVSGFLDTNDSQIPVIFEDTIANKGSNFWSLEADPIIRNIPANKPVTVLPWDPTKGAGNIVSVQDDLDQQLPGARVREARDVTFDRLSASGETTDSITVTTDSIAGDLEAAEVALPPGIYRVSMEGTEASYLAKVGTLKNLITDFQKQANGAFTDIDETVRSKISGGSIIQKRVTTGPDGYFEVPISSSANAVQVQGLKQPDITEGNETVSLLNSTESYEIDTLQGSMYLPTTPQRVELPASNVELTMTEISVNPFAGAERVNNLTAALRAAIGNITMADLPSSLQQPTSNVSREDLENVTSRLQNLSTENEQLEQRLQDALANETDSTEIMVNVSEQSTAELRERLSIMRQELTELRGQLTVEPGDGSVSDGTVSRTFVVDGAAIPEDGVAVFADYSNGTSTLVDDEYLTVDQSATAGVAGSGQTEIRITDYPLGDTDPAAVQFRVDVASEDGVGSGVTEPITNPAVDADPPGLEHVDFSSLHPGPSEQTSLRVVGEDEGTFARVTSATVVAPDGSTIDSSVSNGETIAFETAGEGTHVVRTTFEDTSGNTYTTPLRVVASNRSYNMPATMRVSSAPAGGTFALTGDGLAGGKVVTDQTRSNVDLTARLDAKSNGDPEIPDRLKVWTSSMHLPAKSDITVRTVDETGQSVDERIPVKIHTANLPEDGYMYRQSGGDWEPFTKTGSQWGSWETTSGQTVINTVTDADGQISIRRSADPGLREQIWYRIQTSLNSLPF